MILIWRYCKVATSPCCTLLLACFRCMEHIEVKEHSLDNIHFQLSYSGEQPNNSSSKNSCSPFKNVSIEVTKIPQQSVKFSTTAGSSYTPNTWLPLLQFAILLYIKSLHRPSYLYSLSSASEDGGRERGGEDKPRAVTSQHVDELAGAGNVSSDVTKRFTYDITSTNRWADVSEIWHHEASMTVEPDSVATETLTFPSKLSRN